MVRFGAKR